MKRITVILVIAALLLSLCSCGVSSNYHEVSQEDASAAIEYLEDASSTLDSLYRYLNRACDRGDISADAKDEIIDFYLLDIESDIEHARRNLK